MPRPPPPPGPERDRALAARPKLGGRWATPLGDVVGALMKSEEVQRMRRFQRVNGALKDCLPEGHRAKLKPTQLRGGVLTIDVADGLLLAELRQHHTHAVIAALAAAGTGVSRVVWRLERAGVRRPT
jgi:predicted nucleic acid-binding Zn ribbon protein